VKDRERYRQHCERMVARYAETRDPEIAERIGKACLLCPAEDGLLRAAAELCDRSAALGAGHGYEAFFLFARGLAEYRQGDLAAARKTLESIPQKFPNANAWSLHTPRLSVLAMTLFRAGDRERARRVLGNAFEQQAPLRVPFCAIPLQGWSAHNGLIARVFLREAHELIEGGPLNEWLTMLLRAHVYRAIGEGEKAETEMKALSAAPPRNAQEYRTRGSGLAQLGLMDFALEDFEQALKMDPESAQTFLARARLFAYARQWEKAAADLKKFVARSEEGDWVFRLAPLLVLTKDVQGYQQHCRALLARFSASRDPFLVERTAKACLFMPPADAYREPACGLADRAVALDPHNWLSRYIQFAKGLAEYRRGNCREAAEWCRQALRDESIAWFLRTDAESVLAMALARVNETDMAKQHLARARQILQVESTRFEQPGSDEAWHDWLICRFLLAEAQQVLDSQGASKQTNASREPIPTKNLEMNVPQAAS
jgi:tetratricopeptide (TPR) repeat protein